MCDKSLPCARGYGNYQNLDKHLLMTLTANRSLCRKAFSNVIGNAVRHSLRGSVADVILADEPTGNVDDEMSAADQSAFYASAYTPRGFPEFSFAAHVQIRKTILSAGSTRPPLSNLVAPVSIA